MAYGEKYRFVFVSDNGTEYQIGIHQKDWTGGYTLRPLGAAPVLRRDRSDSIYGTSLEIQAECQVDGEFREMYTSDPFMYKMTLETRMGADVSSHWWGYVSPELYSEPDIAPPYDVSITAVDGLGELKRDLYEGCGDVVLGTLLTDILSHTGSSRSVRFLSGLKLSPSGNPGELLSDLKADMDKYIGKSLYDVLQAVLESFHMGITCMGDCWLVFRETDVITSYSEDSEECSVWDGTTEYDYPVRSVGSMSGSDWWPVGQLTAERKPAEKSVKITSNAEYMDVMADPTFQKSNVWTKYGTAWGKGYMQLGGSGAYISQARTFIGNACQALKLRIRAYAFGGSAMTARALTLRVSRQQGNQTYYLKTGTNGYTWVTSDNALSVDLGYAYTVRDEGNCITVDIDVPLSYAATAKYLSVMAENNSDGQIVIHEVSMSPEGDAPQYEIKATIENGAREASADVSIPFAHVLKASSRVAPLLYCVLKKASDSTYSVPYFLSSRITTAGCLHQVMAKDYALSVAASRWKYSGVLNVPKDFTGGLPLLFMKGTGICLVDTFSWNLLRDELDLTFTEVPVATVTTTL